MSYFDHVQCHTCGARMDPEKIVPGRGEMPACPYCGAALELKDLFGVKDAFVGMDDELGNAHSLDDLVGGELYDSRYVDGRPPPRAEPQAPSRPAAPRGAAAPARGAPAASRGPAPSRPALPGPTAAARKPPTPLAAKASDNALVRQVPVEDDTPAPPPPRRKPGQAPSAADLLRDMKKKK